MNDSMRCPMCGSVCEAAAIECDACGERFIARRTETPPDFAEMMAYFTVAAIAVVMAAIIFGGAF